MINIGYLFLIFCKIQSFAEEGDFIWVAYGENEVYSHILIDGGTDECGEEFASIISIIDERKEKIEALVLTHVDYDHIQGALEGICRISNETNLF